MCKNAQVKILVVIKSIQTLVYSHFIGLILSAYIQQTFCYIIYLFFLNNY